MIKTVGNRALLAKGLLTAAVLLGTFSAAAQDIQRIVNNIAPVGQVCLAGQNCDGAAPASAPAAPAAAPVAATTAAAPTGFDAAAVYQQNCFACHGSGAAGAPKLGDRAAWEERMAKGMDQVVANAINGVNVMPPKGMCMTCSDDDIRALVEYMVSRN